MDVNIADTIKRPEVVISMANAIGLASITFYLYKIIKSQQDDLKEKEKQIQALTARLDRIEQTDQQTTRAIRHLNTRLEDVGSEATTIADLDVLNEDILAVASALEEHGIDIDLPSQASSQASYYERENSRSGKSSAFVQPSNTHSRKSKSRKSIPERDQALYADEINTRRPGDDVPKRKNIITRSTSRLIEKPVFRPEQNRRRQQASLSNNRSVVNKPDNTEDTSARRVMTEPIIINGREQKRQIYEECTPNADHSETESDSDDDIIASVRSAQKGR